MPGPCKGYTTPHRCVTVNSSRRNQPSDRDRQARQKLQEKTSDFHTNSYDCVYLSIGPEAKRDIHNTFDPDKPFNIHLDPQTTERLPLVEIKQDDKASIYNTDFYFTNMLPSNIVVLSPSKNNTMPTGYQAAAADRITSTHFEFIGEHIKTKEDTEATFHTFNLCPQENKEEKSNGRK